jgi:hypothetical protein
MAQGTLEVTKFLCLWTFKHVQNIYVRMIIYTCVVIVVLVIGWGHLQPVVCTIALICCCLQSRDGKAECKFVFQICSLKHVMESKVFNSIYGSASFSRRIRFQILPRCAATLKLKSMQSDAIPSRQDSGHRQSMYSLVRARCMCPSFRPSILFPWRKAHTTVTGMDEGTLKTPIPSCRLYWSFLFGGGEANM